LFSDISVDPSTNQITLRSEFPNPDLDLLPGSYVRVRLDQAVQPQGISVPQRAILRDSAGVPKVLLVDPQKRISERQVVLGSAQGDRWIISEGLAPGDRVVVEGLQHVKAGDQVQVDEQPGASAVAQHTGQ
ncbi:MAG: efflux transporter periplasmic adaptor subunit, partial [Pseudomonas sp.]|nr:efflux transporter periplasmic adaptor subunit [Pseudomonas sp.]